MLSSAKLERDSQHHEPVGDPQAFGCSPVPNWRGILNWYWKARDVWATCALQCQTGEGFSTTNQPTKTRVAKVLSSAKLERDSQRPGARCDPDCEWCSPVPNWRGILNPPVPSIAARSCGALQCQTGEGFSTRTARPRRRACPVLSSAKLERDSQHTGVPGGPQGRRVLSSAKLERDSQQVPVGRVTIPDHVLSSAKLERDSQLPPTPHGAARAGALQCQTGEGFSTVSLFKSI